MTFRKSSYFHGLNISDDTYSGSFEGEYTGSISASVTGAFVGDGAGLTGVVSVSHAIDSDASKLAISAVTSLTASHVAGGNVFGAVSFLDGTATGTFTGSVTGAVAVLSSGSGKEWARSTGSDAGGSFNANDFTLGELGPRFAALVDELLVFIPLPAGPTASTDLPQLGSLQLFVDTREQGNTSIIEETVNGHDMRRTDSGTFAYRTGPPSVDIDSVAHPRAPTVPTARMRLNADGIQTSMILMKPESLTDNQYVIEYSNGNNILLGFVDGQWEWFSGGSETTGDDPRTSTQIPATASVWQTVCYTVDVDGAAKQNGYHNGLLSIGPLNKTFDLIQPQANLDIGHTNGGAPFTGSFGYFLQWTTVLTAAEIKQAHNFLRSIDAGYGLPEAL